MFLVFFGNFRSVVLVLKFEREKSINPQLMEVYFAESDKQMQSKETNKFQNFFNAQNSLAGFY